MPKKPASSRAIDHCLFSFGLVTIPLSVYGGVDGSHGIKRKEFVSVPVLDENGDQKTVKVEREDGTTEEVPVFEDHPVGRMAKDKVTEKPVENGQEVLRKIDTEYGFVYVEDHEIETLFDISPKTIEVVAFQPQHLFYQGNYVPKSLYFVEPRKEGKKNNPKVEQAFSLVLKAMREEGAMALVEFTTRGIPKPAVLLPNGTLWVIYHTEELREQRPLPEVELPEAAINQGRMLIKALWDDNPQDVEDKRTALIQNFANEKAAAGDFGRSVETQAVAEVTADSGTDLMAMLAASVEQAKQERSAG